MLTSKTGIPITNVELLNSNSQEVLTAAKGGGISFLGKVFEYVLRFVFSIIVARAIGAEQFGLYTLGLTVVAIVSMVSLLGLQTGMIRFLPQAIRQKDEAGIWGIIQVGAGLPALMSLGFTLAIYFLSDILAVRLFHEPRLGIVLRLSCLCVPLDTLGSIAWVVVMSYKQPKYTVIANNIVFNLVKLILTVAFLALALGIAGILTAHILATAVGLITLIYFLNSLFFLKRPLHNARRDVHQLLRYSLPAYLGWVVNTVRGTFETLVLGFIGLTTGVGIYAAALRLSVIGSMFFLSIGNISTPIIADLYSRGEFDQLKSYYQTTARWLVIFNFPLFMTFFIFATPLLAIFGSDFTEGAPGLRLLALGTLVYTGTGFGAQVLDMTDHVKINTVNSFLMVFITIGLDILLIPRWGVIGAAAASTLTTVLINGLCLIEVFILLRMQPYNLSFLKPILAGLVSAFFTYSLADRMTLNPLLTLIGGSIFLWSIYAIILALLRFPREDLMVVNSLYTRFKTQIILILNREKTTNY